MSYCSTFNASSNVLDSSVWLEGDNAGNSTDSRHYGPVPASMVLGRVAYKVYPLGERGAMRTTMRAITRTVTRTTTQKVKQPSWVKKSGGGGGGGATYTTAGTRVEKFETPAMAGLRIDPRSGKTWKSGGGRVHHNASKIAEWRGLKGTHALEKDVAIAHGEATKQDRPQANFRAATRKQGYWRG